MHFIIIYYKQRSDWSFRNKLSFTQKKCIHFSLSEITMIYLVSYYFWRRRSFYKFACPLWKLLKTEHLVHDYILGNLPKNGLTAGCSKQGRPRLKGHPRPDPNKNCPLCVWHPRINKAVRSLLKSRELGLGLYWWYPGKDNRKE